MIVYIYKLIKKDATNDDMIYIGSTEDIKDRMRRHKISCNNIKRRSYNNCKVYKYIRDNGGWDAWTYEIIDEVEVVLREDAARYEGEYIIKYDAINKLNEVVAGRTRKEYCVQNVEKIKEKDKKYYQQNKVQIKQKNNEYRNKNKEHILQKQKEYRNKNKEQIKQKSKEYQNKNKERIKQYQKEYREKNRDAIMKDAGNCEDWLN